MTRDPSHPALPAGTWRGDPRQSSGTLLGPASEPVVAGRFAVLDTLLSTSAGRTSLTVLVATASLAPAGPTAVGRPHVPALLDAVRFPLLRFASTSVRRCGAQVEVHGDLTVRTVARPLRAVGTVAGPQGSADAARVVVDLEAVVDLREYGLGHAACLDGVAGAASAHDVVLVLHAELTAA